MRCTKIKRFCESTRWIGNHGCKFALTGGLAFHARLAFELVDRAALLKEFDFKVQQATGRYRRTELCSVNAHEDHQLACASQFQRFDTKNRSGLRQSLNLKHAGHDGGATDIQVGLINFFLVYADHLVGYRFVPRGLQETDIQVVWMVRADAEEGRDYNRVLEAREARVSLGWTSSVDFVFENDVLTVFLAVEDADGAPVTGARLTGVLDLR